MLKGSSFIAVILLTKQCLVKLSDEKARFTTN